MTNDVSKETINWANSKPLEQRIAELETRNKELTDELTALKAEVTERKQSVWLPEKNQEYCFVAGTGYPERQIYRGILYDISLQKNNNVFKYDNLTFKHLAWYNDNVLKVQNKLMQLHELLCPDYFPDWNNHCESKFVIYYDTSTKQWFWDTYNSMNMQVVMFTKEATERACEILNAEKFMMCDDA